MIQIDSTQVHGEPGTGYEPAGKKGAFECANCEYFAKNSCGQRTMMERSKVAKTENGRVIVDPKGCCEYIDRVGNRMGRSAKSWMKKGEGK